jgi:hypothetical protein
MRGVAFGRNAYISTIAQVVEEFGDFFIIGLGA